MKKRIIIIGLLCFFFLSIDVTAWQNSTFDIRQEIQIDNNDYQPTDYVILLNMTYDSDMNADFSDIRFSNSSDNVALNYWIRNKVNGVYADIEVKIPNLFSNSTNTTLYIYYKNNSVVSSNSNGFNTFPFFDDFSDNDYTNNPTWTAIGGSPSASGGKNIYKI